MRICHLVASLEERHGGPSKSVRALSVALARLGHDVDLLTLHATGGDEQAEGTLRTRTFPREFPSLIARSAALRRHLRTLACDVVHNHALWLRPLHYAHRHALARGVPLVNSPRGMMSPWAWHHHGWRKKLARLFIHPRALEDTAGWHATSSEEAADIRALGFSQPVCVAPNGVTAPSAADHALAAAHWRETCPAVTRHPTALFYSRLHRKKRVLELIDLWLERAPKDWLLLMVGVPDDYTPAQLETYVMRSSGRGRIHLYDGEGRPPPYAVASLFLLPSHSENFGLVIAEAMAHGVPVLVTDTTPWSALNRNGAGWCVNWNDYAAVLAQILQTPSADLASRGALAREWVVREFSWEQSARQLAEFYRQLASTRTRSAHSSLRQ